MARQSSFTKALGHCSPQGQCPRARSDALRARCQGGAQEKIPRLPAKQAPAKVETKLRKVAEKDKSSDKKVQTKGRKRSKVKTVEEPTKSLKIYLQKTAEIKNQVSPASDEAREKEAKSD